MAIINCPECGKAISDKAISCPTCGLPFGNRTNIDESKQKQKKNQSVFNKPIGAGGGCLILIILIALAGLCNPNGYDNPPEQIKKKTTEKKIKPLQIAGKVTAEKICEDFNQNQIAAIEKYKGNAFEISGIISNISKSAFGNMYVFLSPGNCPTWTGVSCRFPEKYRKKLARLKKGQKITAQCTYDGVSSLIVFEDCEFVY